MKIIGKLVLLILILSAGFWGVSRGQSTAFEVYKILHNNCTFSSCHSTDSPVLGLDLQGSGPDSMMQVFDNIVGVRPNNVYASNEGFEYIKPGDPARSFLFRKIHNGLDPTITLDVEEGEEMPPSGGTLNEREIELIRQWILYGAPIAGEVIDTNIIFDFYTNNGIQSVPDPPLPPEEGDGFQIHLGPFFIPPGGEDEVFLKYDPKIEEDQEISRVEVFMGDESHHFILYRFFAEDEELCGGLGGGVGADDFPDGFRDINLASHFSANFQFGAQNTESVELPYKTAFAWDEGAILDLNSHYINFNQNQVLASEVFINVYTQPAGTAEQEMQAIMIPNLDLNIPNNGEEITFSSILPVSFCFPQGLYVWATTCHTHQLGQDYDIYVTDSDDNDIDHIYDGSCFIDGEPGCLTEFYDYQHPPTRLFDEYHFLSSQQGIRHEASYINNGPEDVGWGFTSEDEMMLFFFFYVLDTTGLNQIPNIGPTAEDDTSSTMEGNEITIEVLSNDNDIDGSLNVGSVEVISGPSDGTTTVNPNGSITYEPDDGFSGIDEFEYVVCDDGDPPICDTAIVTIEVEQSPTGLFSNEYGRVAVYPNPSTGSVFITDPEGTIRDMTLLSIQGKKLIHFDFDQSAGIHQLDLDQFQLPEGIYWLVVEGIDDQRGVSRIVLQSAR